MIRLRFPKQLEQSSACLAHRLAWRRLLGGTLLLTALACAAMLAAPFEAVLRDYSSDDSFYYSEVARRFAQTGFSSFDGFEPTNGYHPLWMLMCSLVYLVGFDGEGAIYATRVLEVLLIGGGVFGFQLAMRGAGMRALAGAVLWLLAWRTHALVEGLETALLFALLGAIAHAFVALRGLRRARWLGALALAAGLARLEAFALFPILALLVLLDDRDDAPRAGSVLWITAPCVAGLAAYLTINALTIGSAVPVSGLVKQAWSAAARAASADPSLLAHFEALWHKSKVRDGLLFGGAALAIALLSRARKRPCRAYWSFAAGLAALHVVRVAYFTVTNWPPLSSYEHYYITGPIVRFAVLAGVASAVLSAASRWRYAKTAQLVAALAIAAVLGRAMHKHVKKARAQTVDWEIASYRAAQALAQRVPAGARVGSFDSGVLGYFAPQAVTNLDGLINSPAFHRAVQAGEGVAWLCARRIAYFCNAGPLPGPDDGAPDPLVTKLWTGLGLRGAAPRRLRELYRAPERDQFPEGGRAYRVRIFRIE